MQKYFLGIDVSKGYADFVFLNEKKEIEEENFQLDDTFSGHFLLHEKLAVFLHHHPESCIFGGIESTGGYENNWFNSLSKFQGSLNIRIARLNPFGVNANSKADLKRNTTDKISAQNVAEYLIAHPEKVTYEHEDYYASLRKQWAFIKILNKQSTQLLNQLEILIYTANPEIVQYCKDGVPGWVLKLLMKYPTASKLSKAKIKTVAKIPYINVDRAAVLIQNAKKSVAAESDFTTEQLISATVNQILQVKKTIKSQIEIMAGQCSVPEVELLKTFKGISDYSAIGLILEIQSVERFSSVKKIASFFGVHPVFKTSGDGCIEARMSKKGRKEVRHILFMVTLASIRHNPLISLIYQERIEKGMERMAAIGYCMHKILRIIYGMLKNNTAFDPAIDQKNREEHTKRKRVLKDKNRRIQGYDAKAPISRRQSIKRKERNPSQSDGITVSGIEAPFQSEPNKHLCVCKGGELPAGG